MPFQSTKDEIYLRRIFRHKEAVQELFVSNVTPITDIVLRETPNFENYEDAVKANDYKPIRVGDVWGGGDNINGWFKFKFTVPNEMQGKEVAAYIDIDGEGCAYIDGKPYQGLDKNHIEMLLTKNAKGGETYEIIVDATSIHWPHPDDKSRRTLKKAEFGTRNMEVQEYWFNVETLYLLALELDEESPRRKKIIYTLNKSVDVFDLNNTDPTSLKKSAKAANAALKPLLDCKANASATNVAVHGHSHIDVAWLWPYVETKRKVGRTFSTVMRMMEQYPEYIFSQSQAQLYQFCKDKYPTLYEEIKKKVKEGKWDVTGSMWVEADCNVCSGESLIRQILIGKNFYIDEFGIETDVLWLPDVFGYSAALPQILKKARVPYFSTIKINWSQINHFPFNTFHWKGIDGTTVLAHFPPTTDYNAFPQPSKLLQQVNEFAEKDRCDWSLLSFGWGDGGGGADRRHFEFLRRSKDLEGLPRCQMMKVTDFFHKIDGFEDYPQWVGELYLELHRATYTTQGRNKKYNRRAEFLYREAELFSSIAMNMGLKYPYEELNKQWKDILLNQFHDVIPGSSIRQVYIDTDKMYPEIIEFGEKTTLNAQSKIVEDVKIDNKGEHYAVFNSLSWDRKDIVEIDIKDKKDYSVLDKDGNEIPSQKADGKLIFIADVPSMGYSTYTLAPKSNKDYKSDLKVSKKGLENKFYKIELDNKGSIKSLIHKETGREVLPDGMKANILRLYDDRPNDYDAWDIDMFYDRTYEDILDVQSIEIIDGGPISAGVEIKRKFGSSELVQKIVIYSECPRIDFKTYVDWHESHKCLKAIFPVNVNSATARYEIQFGNVIRNTHENTSWDLAKFEVCAHKWADFSEENFGVTMLNDCKYGHHIDGNEMRLTLLRAPKSPDREADMGEHEFTYSIMPHSGDYISANVVRLGYQMNVPMRAVNVKGSAKGTTPADKSFMSIDAENVIIETVKKAEREDTIVVRVYEANNKKTKATIKTAMPFKKVYECDLMEDNISEIKSKNGEFSFEIMPFEIKTFKLV
ncbi:MAG: alpha-mannosidase [Armatimonadota bacterium]